VILVGHCQSPSHFSCVLEQVNAATHSVLVISPFLGPEAAELVFGREELNRRLLTSMDESTPIKVIEHLMAHGVQIRSLRHLHAKVYVFDANIAILTSANLTGQGLGMPAAEPRPYNRELGLLLAPAESGAVVNAADDMWRMANPVDAAAIERWRQERERVGGAPVRGRRFDVGGEPLLRFRYVCEQADAETAIGEFRETHETAETALDGDLLVNDVMQSGSVSARAFLWLIGWCNTGGAYANAGKAACAAAEKIFGYVPDATLHVGDNDIDLREWRYRPDEDIPEDIRVAMLRRHEEMHA